MWRSLSPQHLLQPLTIERQAGSDETVLFCWVSLGGHIVKAPYGEGMNWKEVARGRSRFVQWHLTIAYKGAGFSPTAMEKNER